jgi:hypothetical protein
LESESNGDRALQAALRWSNYDLRLWSPWISAGTSLPAPQVNREEFSAARWRVRDADLILVNYSDDHSQLCMPGTGQTPLTLSCADLRESAQVIRLTEGKLETLTPESKSGPISFTVNRPKYLEVFVVTNNSQVINYLRQMTSSRHATELAADQLEIANYLLEQAGQLVDARFRPTRPLIPVEDRQVQASQQRYLMNTQQLLDRGWRALQGGRLEEASRAALESIDSVQAQLHESFQVATENLATAQSSPMVLTPEALKYHWLLASACGRSQWEPLEIPGNGMINLSEMLHYGWTHQRRLLDQVDVRVELIPLTGSPAHGLRMAAYPKQSSAKSPHAAASGNDLSSKPTRDTLPGGYEGASLVVRSAPAAVRKGQLIRIAATALVRYSSPESSAGLLVYDSQGGPSLGMLVRGESGQRVPIELYRLVTDDQLQFHVLAECRGSCDIQLESLTASVITPATDRSSFATSPMDAAAANNPDYPYSR